NTVVAGHKKGVFINDAISRDTVQKHTRQEIHRTLLVDSDAPPSTVRTPGATERPASLSVYRPHLPVSQSGSGSRARQEIVRPSLAADVVSGPASAQDLPPVPGRSASSTGYIAGNERGTYNTAAR